MNKNRIGGLRWRASKPMIAKPISIKLTGGRSGGCASKAVDLNLGRSAACRKTRLRRKQFILIVSQKSAEGKVGRAVGKASKELRLAAPVRYAAMGSMGTSS
jgi:hypothetical protein